MNAKSDGWTKLRNLGTEKNSKEKENKVDDKK